MNHTANYATGLYWGWDSAHEARTAFLATLPKTRGVARAFHLFVIKRLTYLTTLEAQEKKHRSIWS